MDAAQAWTLSKRASTADVHHVRAINGLGALLANEASPVEAAEIITKAYEDFLLSDPDVTTTEFDSGNKIMAFWALYMCEAIRTFGSESEWESYLCAKTVQSTTKADRRVSTYSNNEQVHIGIQNLDL